MIRGLYGAASGLQSATEFQDVTAHNLAHASTPGYRNRGLVAQTFDVILGRAQEPTGDLTGTAVTGVYHDFRPGPLRQTDAPFDFALTEPDQFFTVRGPNGPLYTRNGTFRLTPDGNLVTASGGYPLLGEDGPLTIPPGAIRVVVASDGSVTADGEPAGNIRPVRFNDIRQLTSAGPTLYTAPPTAGPVQTDGRVLQGWREGANTEPAESMVKMIETARYFEAAQRALRAIGESIQLNTRPQT